MIGSCFAENMGGKMTQEQFPGFCVNPFGILYNPISIARCINHVVEEKTYGPRDLHEYKGLWHSWDHHGSFKDTKQESILLHINSRVKEALQALKKSSHLLITLGTTHAFRLKSTSAVVANCHKVPQAEFDKVELGVEQGVDALKTAIQKLRAINPNIHIAYTLSPVRHLKDGLQESFKSKAKLRVMIDMLCDTDTNESYFPAYEIMMDELRDYRYYGDDMLHPSPLAQEIIWSKFKQGYFSQEAKVFSKEMAEWIKMDSHRLLHPETEESLKFISSKEKKKDELNRKYPFLSSQD
jgi:lysophospholipase L1-like esterase